MNKKNFQEKKRYLWKQTCGENWEIDAPFMRWGISTLLGLGHHRVPMMHHPSRNNILCRLRLRPAKNVISAATKRAWGCWC